MAVNEPLEAVFHEALAKTDPAERAAFLDSACADQPELRQRVDALLAAHAERGKFLGGTAGATVGFGDLRADQSPAAPLGSLIADKYKLLEIIGEGGMGTVYMAEQIQPVRRKVAVKIIKPGMDSHSVLARFEAERQALALMDHPNIACVLDAGATERGLPFFVMELVKGTPINKFCDDRRLSPRERLELFIPVCQAIQHAHQKGVIHRDIKPSNVLVALYDDRPAPKVIDFGVAKATGQALTERTLHTGFGAIIGTPEYMSPEQATFNQLDIDTRSDVYALGVLLYELLTGTTPVDKSRLKQAAVLEVLRLVREEDPPRPSVKLTSAEKPASIAAVRGTQPGALAKLLRGELDWIVMKALEKDRNRRYDSAGAFAADVRRYLSEEVVEARPPSTWYRLRKLSRRYRGALSAATLVAAALVFCAGISLWLAARATFAERHAQEQYRAARAMHLQMMMQRDRAVMEQARAEEAQRQALAESEVTHSITSALSKQAFHEDFEPSLASLAESLRKARGLQDPDVLLALKTLGHSRVIQKKVKEAEPVQADLAEGLRLLRGESHPETIEAMVDLSVTRALLERNDEAEQLAQRAWELCDQALAARPKHEDREKLERLSARVLMALSTANAMRGNDREAARLNAEAMLINGLFLLRAGRAKFLEETLTNYLPMLQKHIPDDWQRFAVLSLRGFALAEQKKYAEAETALKEAYEGLHQRAAQVPVKSSFWEAQTLRRLVEVYEEWGKPDEAAAWKEKFGN